MKQQDIISTDAALLIRVIEMMQAYRILNGESRMSDEEFRNLTGLQHAFVLGAALSGGNAPLLREKAVALQAAFAPVEEGFKNLSVDGDIKVWLPHICDYVKRGFTGKVELSTAPAPVQIAQDQPQAQGATIYDFRTRRPLTPL